jgi:hypothetical protein
MFLTSGSIVVSLIGNVIECNEWHNEQVRIYLWLRVIASSIRIISE